MIKATASITANVRRYCRSLTAKENRGGTKKKSKLATLTNAASTAGPRPHLTATSTTTSRNSITMFARSKYARKGVATSVIARQAASDHT